MEKLAHMNCTRAAKGTPPLPAEEIDRLRRELPEWQLVSVDGEQRLTRVFKCKDFAQALALTNRIGAVAEAQDHHPALLTEWGKVTVWWWTHTVGGLHLNDFIMAARTDELA